MKLTHKLNNLLENKSIDSWKDVKFKSALLKDLKKPTGSDHYSKLELSFEDFKIVANITSYSVAGKWGKGSQKKYSYGYKISKDGKEYEKSTPSIVDKKTMIDSIKKAIFRYNKNGDF